LEETKAEIVQSFGRSEIKELNIKLILGIILIGLAFLLLLFLLAYMKFKLKI
jgi:hypothetical protein